MTIFNQTWLRQIYYWDVSTLLAVSKSAWRKRFITSARLVSRSADGWLYGLIPVAIYPWNPQLAAELFTTLLLGFMLERFAYYSIKNRFKRRRPHAAIPGYQGIITAADEFSFPSGHTSGAFLLSTSIFMHVGNPALALYLWASLVGASRIVLGVHFPTDIFAGAMMGALAAVFVAGLI
jgi:undecaprenyl-diphosphatase